MVSPDDFTVLRFRRVEEIDRSIWDCLTAGQPFFSYDWMHFGEKVLSDCTSVYLILFLENRPVACAVFWLVSNEPLPVPVIFRPLLAGLMRRRPLLICRSPLANWMGMLLPDDSSLRTAARARFHVEGMRLLQEWQGSYLIFDFLDEPDLSDWPASSVLISVADPGTRLEVAWNTFEDYLARAGKRGRQHYRRVQREAEERGLIVNLCTSVEGLEEALQLIRIEERKFHSAPNPWMRPLLENIPQAGGAWFEVRQHNRLAGCGLLLKDESFMLAAALGLAKDVQYAYFLLIYACLQYAIQRGAQVLRFGSGAYDVKRRLGCTLENNHHAVVASHAPGLQRITKWLSSQ